MKKIISLAIMSTLLVNAELSVESIKEMVQSIHQKRKGVKLSTLDSTVEPFVRVQKDDNVSDFFAPEVKKTEVKLTLHAIMNGKAFIDGKWMQKGDYVKGYALKYIGTKGVVLRSKNSIKKLFLNKKKSNFIKIEEKK